VRGETHKSCPVTDPAFWSPTGKIKEQAKHVEAFDLMFKDPASMPAPPPLWLTGKSMNYRKILIVILLLALLFVYSDTKTDALSLAGPVKTLETPAYNLRGTDYVPLLVVCKTHGVDWEWDAIGKVVVLKKNGIEARMKLDSYKIYVNGRIDNLEKPARFHKHSVVVPLKFAQKTIDRLFKERPAVTSRIVSPSTTQYTIDTIVIDPGHGGKDPGALGRYSLKEKNLVLDIAKLLKKELESNGIKVKLTRDSDVFIPLGKRAEIANKNEADFFISVHANAFRSRRARGFEVYYLSEATDDTARALEAAENESLKYEGDSFYKPTESPDYWGLIMDENRRQSKDLASTVCQSVSRKLAVKNRGVKSARFYVLKYACMPSVLIEVGFLSNTNDASSLKNGYYRKKLAESMAEGVLSYKEEYERTNGFTE